MNFRALLSKWRVPGRTKASAVYSSVLNEASAEWDLKCSSIPQNGAVVEFETLGPATGPRGPVPISRFYCRGKAIPSFGFRGDGPVFGFLSATHNISWNNASPFKALKDEMHARIAGGIRCRECCVLARGHVTLSCDIEAAKYGCCDVHTYHTSRLCVWRLKRQNLLGRYCYPPINSGIKWPWSW